MRESGGFSIAPVMQRLLEEAYRLLAGVPLLVLALLIVWASWLLGRWISRRKLIDRAARTNPFMQDLTRTTVRWLVLGAGVVVALELMQATALVGAVLGTAGVLGVALGFGAQNLVRDVLAGWFILVEDRYGVGDTIDAGAPAVGTVERVTLRSTRLRDINGTVWHVANGEILRVGNKSQSWSRAVVDVAVTPDADLERAREILGEVGERMLLDEAWSGLVTSSPNVLGVQRIDPLGITLRVVIDTAPGEQFPVEREYRLRVLQAFDAAGISLSAPYAGGPAAAAWPGGPGGPGGTGTGDTGTGEAGPSSST